MNTPVPPIIPVQVGRSDASGTLRVDLGTQSMQFNRTAVVEIRDENMALVQRTESGVDVSLPPGLYQISAVLQDGAEYRHIANLQAGARYEVRLESGTAHAVSTAASKKAALGKRPRPGMATVPAPPPPTAPPQTEAPPSEPAQAAPETEPAPAAVLPPIMAKPPMSGSVPAGAAPPSTGGLVQRALRVLKRAVRGPEPVAAPRPETAPSPVRPPPPPPPPPAEPALVSLEGATELRQLPDGWFLQGTYGARESIPTARVRVGADTWCISLPLNEGQGDCTVQVAPGNTRVPVTAWISPDRTMSAALQNMLLNGEYEALLPVAGQAIDLLRSKYHDPTGAALGALILYKVGRLSTYVPWLENLARDFPWIPDGDVLLASMLVQEHRELDRALQLALSAAQRRMLLSESYSILLDMLRRWPDRAAMEPHRPLVEDVVRRGAYVAWGSLFFCHAEGG